MKNIFKAFYVLAAASFVLASCAKEQYPEPTVGEPEVDGCYGVYFPTQEASGDHTYDPTQDKVISITAKRMVSEGEITVPVVLESDVENVFVAGDLIFQNGQDEATFDVRFDDIEFGKQSSFSITVKDNLYASKYNEGKTAIEVSVLCVEWVKYSEGTINLAGAWDNVYTAETELWYYEVDGLRTCYLKAFYDKTIANETYFTHPGTEEVDYHFTWDLSTNYLSVPLQGSGYFEDGVEMYFGDIVAYYNAYWGVDDDYFISYGYDSAAGYWYDVQGYDRPHFENGDFYLADHFICDVNSVYSGYGYSFGSRGFDVFQAKTDPDNGGAEFIRVDYTLEVESDFSSDGVLPVYFASGIDNVTVKYAAYEGELTATQLSNKAAELAEDSSAESLNPEDGEYDEEDGLYHFSVGVSFEASGYYTVVAVGIDKDGNATESDSVCAWYVSADDLEDADVQVIAGLEPVPQRYALQGYDEYSSMGFFIIGSELTEVHYKFVKTKSFESDPEYYYNAVKNAAAMSEDALAAINEPGGYASLFTNLSDGTSYTLLVWATNGQLEKIVAAEFSTTVYPETFHSLGTGLYTDDLIGPVFGEDPVSYEIEILESDQTPGKYRLVNPYGAAFPYNGEGDWDDSQDWYIDIHAENPEQVYILYQETGCDWGYGNMAIMDEIGYLVATGYALETVLAYYEGGTLTDGIITFPVKGMTVNLPSLGAYYGNKNGAFQVILPDYYTPSNSAVSVKSSVNKKSVKAGKTLELAGNKIVYKHEGGKAQCTVSKIALREHKSASRQHGRETAPKKRF